MYKVMKVYYDNTKGDIIWSASYNYDIEPNLDSDYEKVLALNQFDKSFIGLLVLRDGAYAQDFAECNGYRVNVETKTLEFSYPDPNNPNTEQPYQAPLSEQVKNLEATILEMTAYSAAQDERLAMQEQALLELTTTIAGGNA